MMFHEQKDEPRSMPRAKGRRKARPRRNNLRLNINEFTLEPRTLLTISNFVMASPLNPVEGVLFKNFTGQNAASQIATFTDTNNPSPAQFNVFLSWGDGGFDQGPNAGGGVFILPDGSVPHQFDVYDTPSSGNPTGGHTYLEESINPLTLSLFVTDTIDNGFGFGSSSINVTDAPLNGTSAGTIHPTEGTSFTGQVASFVDTDPNAVLGEWAASIDWGDGTVSAGTITQPGGAKTPLVVTGTHTYAEEGTYPSFDGKGNQIHGPVTVTITDTDGHVPTQGTRATTAVTDTAVVGDAKLSPAANQIPFTAVEGNSTSGVVATFVDANTNAPTTDFSGIITWGDGTTSNFTSSNVIPAGGGVFQVFGTHTYPEEGSKSISTQINDIGGSSTVVSNTATIADATISVAGTQIQAVEGSSKSWTVGTITDNNPNAPASDFSGTVYWGDGTTSTFGPGNVTLQSKTTTQSIWTVSVPHAYKEDGIFFDTNTDPTKPPTTGIVVNDVGGSSAKASSSAYVADAPLHGVQNISIPAQTENVPFANILVGKFSDEDPGGMPTDYTVNINWGDGSLPTAGTVVPTGIDPATGFATFNVLGTHAALDGKSQFAYGEEGTYQVTVQITDTDQHLTSPPGVPRAGTNSTSTITVNDAALSPAAFVPFSPSVGVPFIGKVATFHDTDLGNPGDPTDGTNVGDYSATIIFDTAHPATSTFPGFISYDGTTGNYSVSGSFTYPALGVYNVSVTIKDVGGATVTVGGQVLATLPPPTVTGVNIGAVEGTSFTAPVATFTNPNGNYTGGYSATINWGDTTSSTGVITTGAPGQFIVTGTHTYAETGFYTITTSVTETAPGGGTGTGTSTATVTDAPLIGGPVSFKAQEGQTFTGTIGTFTDTDPGGVVSDYAATITWNDGGLPATSTGTIVFDHTNASGQPVFDVQASRSFVEEGTYTGVTIKVSEIAPILPPPGIPGTPATTTFLSTAVVADAPLTVTTNPYAGLLVTTEGKAFPDNIFGKPFVGFGPVIATFTDADPVYPDTSDYGATIVWNATGPNTGPATPGIVIADPNIKGQFDVLGNLTYPEDGIYSPTVLINDIGGSTATATATVTVNDAPLTSSPTGTTANPLQAVEGSTFNGPVANFTDTDPGGHVGDYTAKVTVGTSTTTGTIVPTGFDASGHPTFQVLGSGIKFAEQGTYSINVTITDDDHDLPATPAVPRQSTSTTSVISVADAPIFGSPVAIANGVEGQAVSDTFSKQYPGLGALVATFTDADPGGHVGDYSATINWGDTTPTVPGTVVADPTIPGQFDVLGNHTFAEDGINTVKVSITDDDHDVGGLTPQSTTVVSSIVTVLDAPLTAGATVPVAAQTEGASFTVPVATFTDADKGGIPGDYLVTIDWGDGTGPQTGTVVPTGVTAAGATFQVLGTHKYTEEAPVLPGGQPYKVTVSITDADGHLTPPPVVPRSSTAATTTITVNDAGLTLAPAAVGGVEGQTSLITVATLTDQDGINTNPGDYVGTITWSDSTTSTAIFTNATDSKGNIIPAVFNVQGFHTFAEEGVSLAKVQVWDTDGVRATKDSVTQTQNVPVTISDAPLTSIGTPVTIANTATGAPIVEGQPTGSVVVATFQDGNPNAPLSDFPSSNVTITWGDGTTSQGTVQPGGGPGQFNVFGTHSYTEEGTFTTKVVIKDVGGSSTTATNTSFSVADAPLSSVSNPLTIQATTGVNTGPKITGTFLDQDPNGGSGVGPQPDYVATIFWGDGQSSTATGFAVQSVSSAGAVVNVIGNHTYALKGSYSIFALVTDVDGGSTVTPRSTTFTFNVTAIVTDPPAAPSTLGAASLSSSSIAAGAFSNVGITPQQLTTSSVTSSTSNTATNAAVDQAIGDFVSNNVVAGSTIIPVTTYVIKKPAITGSLLN